MYTAIVRRVVRTDQNNDVFVLLNDGKVTSIHAATIPTEAFFLETGDEVEYKISENGAVIITKINWKN